MPDLDLLIEVADLFQVGLRELLNGEIKKSSADHNEKETIVKVAEYSYDEKMKATQRMHRLFIAGLCASLLYLMLLFTESADSFFGGLCLGVMSGMMIVGVLITSRSAIKIQKGKQMFLDKVFHHR